jgi:hypothetical protein
MLHIIREQFIFYFNIIISKDVLGGICGTDLEEMKWK